MQVRMLLAAPLLLVALAGCLGDSDSDAGDDLAAPSYLPKASGLIPVAPDPAEFIGTIPNDHLTGATGHIGHQLGELHQGSHNFQLLGHTDASENLMLPAGGFTELHVVGDLAVVSSLTSARGVSLLNVSDPANMRVLSHIYNLDDNWDARISDDAKYLFVGCQGSQAFDCTGVDTSGENPTTTGGLVCAPLATCPGGIAIYDIADPTIPLHVGYLPMGFTHNVFTFIQDDKYYFVNAVANIGEWDPATDTFQLASTDAIPGVHDIAVQKHPLTGDWLLYTGNGAHMSIWNVNDPFNPVEEGIVDEGAPMWHEQTPMPCLIAGRHITIGAGERGSGEPEPVAVVDTTNPKDPRFLGEWKIPDFDSLTGQNNYRYSLHNIDGNCDGQVAVGHYHAGVWVFDISTPERMVEPVTLGYYQPHEQPVSLGWSPVVTAPIGALVSLDVPNVWTAQWGGENNNILFIPDMTTGIYALAPTWEFENGEAADTMGKDCDHDHDQVDGHAHEHAHGAC
ncbi:MAG: LVIVD repeat-containing protein [Thermoplasmatota archaeon]